MNTLTMKKQAVALNKIIKSAKRALLEFEVAQSQWEIAHGKFKVYKNAKSFMRSIK